uniref:Dl_0 protein n=1 Tax=Fopius arisanus TaxID=64838 RepID=A0A0C9QZR1_9HYME
MRAEAYVEIVEQPASKAFRFRYESERRPHGSIPGVNSTPTHKTYPTIRIVGPWLNGRVIVSCVTKDEYRAHPNRVVSKEAGSYHGIFTTALDPNCNEIAFKHLGIQCVKRKDIRKSLEERKQTGVDPFGKGYDDTRITADDLNTVRLCFQVYLRPPGANSRQGEIKLKPVVSDPIHAKQSTLDLGICQLSSAVASVAGGTPLMIFCQKIMKDDIKVRFFEERKGRVVWETFGNFHPSRDVFEQSAIILQTPPYYTQNVDNPVNIFVQLVKPTTNDAGKPVSLQLLPSSSMRNTPTDADIEVSLKRKRKNFKSIDLLEHPNRAPCGCILAPIINPECPIHNPQGKSFNQEVNPIHHKSGFEGTWNVPQMRQKLFYYNESISIDGAVLKKPKYSTDARSPPVFNAGQNANSNILEMPLREFNNPTPCEYRNRPTVGPSYQPLPSPHPSQCMYQSPFPRNTTPIAPDVPAVPFNNQRDWQVQPEPILQPIIVKLSDQQTQPFNYDYNSRAQTDMNQNLLDFDIGDRLNQLSDSLTSALKLSEEIDFEELSRYERNDNNGIGLIGHETYEENDYAVQGILKASQSQKPPDEWIWDSRIN